MLDVLAPNRERTIARSIKSRKFFAGNGDGEKKEIKIKEDKCNSSPNSNEVYTITTCNFMFLLPFTWQEPQSEILSEIAVVGGPICYTVVRPKVAVDVIGSRFYIRNKINRECISETFCYWQGAVTKPKRKGRRFRKVFPMGKPSAMKNLLHVTSCYNPNAASAARDHKVGKQIVKTV